MRVMGLDVGTKTIGVAVSDELGLTAQGVTTVRRKNKREDVAALQALIAEHEVGKVVVGLPLNMDSTEGARAQACRAFGEQLATATALPITYQDERLTTVAAERVLLDGGLSREKRKTVIDQVAASLILQGWLDAQRPPAD